MGKRALLKTSVLRWKADSAMAGMEDLASLCQTLDLHVEGTAEIRRRGGVVWEAVISLKGTLNFEECI